MQLGVATLLLAATILHPVASTTTTDHKTTYEELSKIPLIYRRAAFRETDTETQNSLWREHVKAYRTKHPDLPKPKFQLLDDIEAAFEDKFGGKSDSTKEKVIQQFGEDEAQKIMSILGPPDKDIETGPSSSGVGGTNDARRRSSKPECNCRVGSGSCIASGTGSSACISSTGCGQWWEETCDGMEQR